MIQLTKEELQRRIDTYNALSKEGKGKMAYFYLGKADAYIDLYNELYPEMEGKRAYPLKEE